MASSIHGHISYILEDNSKRPNDLSWIGRKPYEILQLKKTDDFEIQAEIKFKIHVEGE